MDDKNCILFDQAAELADLVTTRHRITNFAALWRYVSNHYDDGYRMALMAHSEFFERLTRANYQLRPDSSDDDPDAGKD